MDKSVILTLRGKLYWPKIVGEPHPHTGLPKYDKGPKWSTDFTPDAASRAKLIAAGCEEKLREPNRKNEKETRTESFLSLNILENGKDGKKNKPPVIKNANDQPWNGAKIGNETIADIKVKVVDYGRASEKGVYLQAVRILKHVPFEETGFEPLSEDDEFFAAATGADDGVAEDVNDGPAEDNLDDDVPF